LVVTLIVLELIEVELSEFMEAGIMSGLDIETNDDGVTPKLRITVFVDRSRQSESSSPSSRRILNFPAHGGNVSISKLPISGPSRNVAKAFDLMQRAA